jgi:hypothetical protein
MGSNRIQCRWIEEEEEEKGKKGFKPSFADWVAR